MGRPASGLDEYLDWQERLESYKASGLSVDEFCLSEGIAKSTYYRWLERLKIELPNGGVVRLPLGVGQVVLVEVMRGGKFFDAVKSYPRESHQVLEWIRQLYDIEDRVARGP